MEKYVVIVDKFLERADGGRIYERGDIYPAPNYYPSKSRIKYLLSKTKGFGQPVIELLEQPKTDETEQEVKTDEGA